MWEKMVPKVRRVLKGDDVAAGTRGEDRSDGVNGRDAISGTAFGQTQYWDGTSWQIVKDLDMNKADAHFMAMIAMGLVGSY